MTQGKLLDFFRVLRHDDAEDKCCNGPAYASKTSCCIAEVHFCCAKLLACWGVASVVIMVPIYIMGSGYYSCGKPFLRTTMAYLAGNPFAETCLAVAACVLVAISVVGIRGLRVLVDDFQPPSCCDAPKPLTKSTRLLRWTGLAVAWVIITSVLSLPSLAYAVFSSLPPENTILQTSGLTMEVVRSCAGAVLFLTSAYIVPTVSRSLAKCANLGHRREIGSHLITLTRSVITLVAPFVAVLLMNQSCNAKWLSLWEPCTHAGQFDVKIRPRSGNISAHFFSNLLGNQAQYISHIHEEFGMEVKMALQAFVNLVTMEVFHSRQDLQLTEQKDICSPPYNPDGR